ncbi:hypothetical protein BT96DRAFT_1011493 [Gymnopus androsaceus JB14]|uniref:Uncharacterized protein n=1 Tax=Gymnopus androsaceus JB14 TaxID=1447944 RepID=A0A6A4IJG1_9AGAR|nr:hypothetical protein BT96DRAFT_1011493 [Gymnopus androsaceus JB14]
MDVENNETLSISSAKSPKSPSFGELPIEISLEILCLAGSQSQATYRALLLTSKVIYNLIRVECIPFLPIVISRKSQVEPFMTWIKASPHLARRLKHLWLIPDSSPTAFDDRTRIIFIIINCPNLVSLACGIRELVDWDILCTAIRKDPSAAPIHFDLQLPLSLKHVTVMDNAPRILHQEQGDIFSQIETLHVIGSRDTLVDFSAFCTTPGTKTPERTDFSISGTRPIYAVAVVALYMSFDTLMSWIRGLFTPLRSALTLRITLKISLAYALAQWDEWASIDELLSKSEFSLLETVRSNQANISLPLLSPSGSLRNMKMAMAATTVLSLEDKKRNYSRQMAAHTLRQWNSVPSEVTGVSRPTRTKLSTRRKSSTRFARRTNSSDSETDEDTPIGRRVEGE